MQYESTVDLRLETRTGEGEPKHGKDVKLEGMKVTKTIKVSRFCLCLVAELCQLCVCCRNRGGALLSTSSTYHTTVGVHCGEHVIGEQPSV